MAGAHHHVERAGTRVGEVLGLQLDEGAAARHVVAGQLEGEAVGLALLVARPGQGGGLRQQPEEVEQQGQQRQRGRVGQAAEPEPPAEPPQHPSRGAVDRPEPGEHQRRRQRDPQGHVPERVMADLVAHDHQHLAVLQPVHEGVPQHDAVGAGEAGDVGVDALGVDALLHLEHSLGRHAGALGERQDACLQALVAHRPEAVEQRLDPDRADQHDEAEKRRRGEPAPQPPAARAAPQQQVGHPDHGGAAEEPDEQRLRRVGGPLAEGLVGEAVGVLAHPSEVEGERQVGNEDHERVEREEDRQSRHPAPARAAAGEAVGERSQPRRRSGEEQHCGHREAPEHRDHPPAVAGAVVAQGERGRGGHGDHRGLGGFRGFGCGGSGADAAPRRFARVGRRRVRRRRRRRRAAGDGQRQGDRGGEAQGREQPPVHARILPAETDHRSAARAAAGRVPWAGRSAAISGVGTYRFALASAPPVTRRPAARTETAAARPASSPPGRRRD